MDTLLIKVKNSLLKNIQLPMNKASRSGTKKLNGKPIEESVKERGIQKNPENFIRGFDRIAIGQKAVTVQ